MEPNEPKKTKQITWHSSFAALLSFFILMASFPTQSQDYQKQNKRHYRSYYRRQTVLVSNACHILERKRSQKPAKPLIAFNKKQRVKPMAEVDPNTAVARADSKPAPQTKPQEKKLTVTPKIEHVSDEKLEELHGQQDDVLAKNDLPVPTSQEHERVRKMVHDKLESKTNVYPLDLAPLYFNFNEDEFSVVDMEPFLMAAEYALQGRTVLIEGHTDNKGADDYNVKLSMKRVQKIRQLMLDMGVPDDRISIVGYGEELGGHVNSTAEGRQLNRRVDFTIF